MTVVVCQDTLCDIADIMKSPETMPFYDRLMAVKPAGLTPNAWASLAKVNRNIFSDIRKRGRLRSDTLEKLLDAIGVSLAQFEAGAAQPALPATDAATLAAPSMDFRPQHMPKDVPVLGAAMGHDQQFGGSGDPLIVEMTEIDLDDTVDFVRRPIGISGRKDVYALYISGISMEPRFAPGELVYVDSRREPSTGDDVIIQLKNGSGDRIVCALVKRLVRRTASYVELEQFNPAGTFRLPVERIVKTHRIIPWVELLGI